MRELPAPRVRQDLNTPDCGVGRNPYIDARRRPRAVRAVPVAIEPTSVGLASIVQLHTFGGGPPSDFVVIDHAAFEKGEGGEGGRECMWREEG